MTETIRKKDDNTVEVESSMSLKKEYDKGWLTAEIARLQSYLDALN